MPRTNIAAQTFAGAYPSIPLAGGSADITFTSSDVVNGNHTPLVNDKTIIVAQNETGGPLTLTIHSQPDSLNRKGDITAYSIGAGDTAMFGPFKSVGWAVDGKLQFDGSHSDLQLAVLQRP